MRTFLFFKLFLQLFDCIIVRTFLFLKNLDKQLPVNREFCSSRVFLENLGLFFQGFSFLARVLKLLKAVKIAQISSP